MPSTLNAAKQNNPKSTPVRPQLLVMAPLIPCPPWDGARLRILQATRALSSYADITFLVFVTSPYDSDINHRLVKETLGVSVLLTEEKPRTSLARRLVQSALSLRPAVQFGLWSSGFARRLRALVTKGNFSAVVILGGPTLVIYRKYCEPLPVVMDICDDHAAFYRRWAAIERSAIRRIYLLIQAKLFTHALRRSAPLTAGCIFISTEDERTSRLPATARSAVIPNHVDPTLLERVKHPDTRSATRLLFVGAMGSYNNRDAVRWFAEHVLPLVTTAYPTAVFRVVGGACDQLDTACSNDGVEIVGYVDDLAAEYVSCDLFVCPLRSGAGIKNKVLEAMAAGCAVVTTSIGAEGLPCREGYDVMIADSALDFADAVVALISNAELRRQLGVNARHTVQANFAEESVQARWREFLKPLCTARR